MTNFDKEAYGVDEDEGDVRARIIWQSVHYSVFVHLMAVRNVFVFLYIVSSKWNWRWGFVLDNKKLGYRDGVEAGKNLSVQEGFDVGYAEATIAGFNWGVARGITRFKPDLSL